MDVVFVVSTLATVPFWILLLVAPARALTFKVVHAVWVFAALSVAYVVMLAMGDSASADSLLTLEGYKELQTSDAAVLAGWIHYLSLDLFAGAWIARDATHFEIPRWVLVACLLFTIMLAPLGIAMYLLARFRLTGATSLDERAEFLRTA